MKKAEHPAVEHLRHNQRQLDADGTQVGVSRQALDETLARIAELEAEVERLRDALADTVNHLDGFVALESRRKVGSHWFPEGRTFPTTGQCAAGRECAQRARQALGDTHD